MDCILCTIELCVTFCIFAWLFCAAYETLVFYLQVTLLLQEFFQKKVKSVNLIMEII